MAHGIALGAPEQGQAEHTKEVEAEEDDNQTADDVHRLLVPGEQRADGAGKSAHGHKQQRKAQHKAQSIFQYPPPGGIRLSAGKIGQVDGQHGEQTGRDEGDETFHKGDKIDHGIPPV